MSRRLDRERTHLLNSRRIHAIEHLRRLKRAALPFTKLFPSALDWCSFPPIKAIIEQPLHINVDFEAFSPLDLANPDSELLENWRRNVHQELCDLLRAAAENEPGLLWSDLKRDTLEPDLGPLETDDAEALRRLKLATTVFGCNRCGSCSCHHESSPANHVHVGSDSEPLFYPGVMSHGCLTRSRLRVAKYRLDQLELDVSWYLDTPDNEGQLHRCRWSVEHLCVDVELGKLATNLVTKVGQDPSTATASDMDQLGIQVICTSCQPKTTTTPSGPSSMKRAVFGWRTAVRVSLNESTWWTDCSFNLLDRS